MKPLFFADVFGWNMTGLLGKDAKWFIGFSRRTERTWKPTAEQIAAAGSRALAKMRAGPGQPICNGCHCEQMGGNRPCPLEPK